MEHKTLSLSDCDIKLEGDSGRFVGYASVFGGVDSYKDTIVKGAYEYTLRKNGKPKMFVQHDSAGLPVGKWISAKEDDHGLLVEGEFTPGMVKADEARAALKHGTVDGLSIGYMLGKNDFEDMADGGRLIKRVSKLVEVSIVTFPADSAARVDLSSVKSEEIEQLETIRDFERFLRDAGGLSKGLTEALVSRARIVFARGEPGDEIDAKAQEHINRILSINI
jgi:HK97 family phage prohead protease